MYYLLLIHADESAQPSPATTGIESMMEAVDHFDADLTQSGQNLGSIRLRQSGNGKIVRIRSGRRQVTDGPFAETKEQLGGIYLIEAGDMDEAVGIASRLPTATFASVEVREAAGVDLRRILQAW